MAQTSLWIQSLIKGEIIWKKEKENHTVPHARTHALPFLLGLCLLCTQLLTVHAANNPTATGQSGTNGSGGGGGVVGGVAGEAILHSHVDACYKSLTYNNGGTSKNGWGIDDMTLRLGPLSTNGNTTLSIGISGSGWGSVHGYVAGVSVYNADNNTLIASVSTDGTSSGPSAWEGDDGWHGAPGEFNIDKGINVNVTGYSRVNIVYYFSFTCGCHGDDDPSHGSTWHPVHYGFSINYANFSGGKTKICAYNEGDVVRSKASFGGTSDASATDTINKTVLNTTQKDITGNGIFQMHVVNGNLLNGVDNTTYLNNAAIRDMEIPNALENVTISDAANTRTVTWEVPKSNGTEYEFKAQTYAVDFDSPTGTTLVMDTELNGTNQESHSHTHQGDIVYVDGASMATKSGDCYTVPYTTQKTIPHAVSVERKLFTTYDGGISCYAVTAKCSVHGLFSIPNTTYNDDLGANVMNFWTKNDTGSMGWWNGLTWNQAIDQIECPYDHIKNVTYYKLNH